MAKWWLDKPMRLIQTNLREIDADLDADELIGSLKEFSADVLLFNTGGIAANYPTRLDFHYRNPYAKGDVAGNVIEKAHQAGIKFIARFDFSKVNEAIADRHPEWLYKSVEGKEVNYNGQVHTCVNGGYQQDCSIAILDEVIGSYPVDGVFFNMIGYQTRDYSGNYHGICQCDSCRKGFFEMYGLELPVKEDMEDPVFRKYEAFRKETSKKLFHRISDFIKSKNPDIAICTYTHEGVDIYRKESNTGIDRRLPEWNYSASDNVRSALNSWDNMVVSNSAVHFVDYPFRHSAVAPDLTALRIAQNIANGGWLDYYVIGTLNNQDDRLCFNNVKELFRFHKENEAYFKGLKSAADVALILPGQASDEYKGIFRMLSGAHVLFDSLHSSVLDAPDAEGRLAKYKVVILPDLRSTNAKKLQVLDSYVNNGGKLLSTGMSSTCDELGNPAGRVQLACSGVSAIKSVLRKTRGTYLRVRKPDKGVLKGFDDLDIVYLDGDMLECELGTAAEGYLGYMPACMFGPPEKCYYTEETDIPGVVLKNYGKGRSAFIPWGIGMHYEKLSNHAHRMLLESVLFNLLQYEKSIIVEATPLVEVSSQVNGKMQLVHAVNLSGQLGTAFLQPVPLRDIKITVRMEKSPVKVFSLVKKSELSFKKLTGGYIQFTIPELGLLETVVLM